MATVIITDSSSDLTIEEARNLGVHMLLMRISFGHTEYIDKQTIDNEQFYQMLQTSSDLPHTAQISPAQFLDTYQMYPQDDIIVLPISSRLSGTYQSAGVAKQMSGRENIYVVDSMTTIAGLALLVEQACALRDAGVPAAQAAQQLQQLAQRVRIYADIGTLKYLVKGGRLPKVAGIAGEALGIKPLISVKNGIINSIGKARGIAASSQLVRKKVEEQEQMDLSLPGSFAYTASPENVPALRALFPEFAGAPERMIGSVVGTHIGPGAAAIAFFAK